MNITILNGNPDAGAHAFEAYLHELRGAYEARGHTAEILALRGMDTRRCLGCWSCWVKTPGRCAVRDDSDAVCRAVVGSGLTVFASPVIMGFTSAVMKRATDKLIPLLLPYIEIDRGECHHVARYDRYPLFGLLLDRNGCDDEDIGIIRALFERAARNFKTTLKFTATTQMKPEDVANEAFSV